MKYLVVGGGTYEIKEILKSHGCIWNAEKKCWITPDLEIGELSLERLSSITAAVDAELIPIKLSKEEEKIQRILGNI